MIDIDSYTKEAICQYFNEHYPQFPDAKIENIISVKVVGDSDIICLIDCGIKGTPKVTIPADKLEFMPMPEQNIVTKEETLEIFNEIEEEDSFELAPKSEIIITDDSQDVEKVKRPANGRRKRGGKK